MEKLKADEGPLGVRGAFTPLHKNFLGKAPEGEPGAHLSDGENANRKDGKKGQNGAHRRAAR